MANEQRNLNPHKPARVAMLLFNDRYAAQSGGSMDFWGTLSNREKCICRSSADLIMAAPTEPKR